MPRPGVYNLSIYRGDSHAWQFVLWDDAAKTDPTDLTGVTAAAQIRATANAADATDLTCVVTLPNIVSVSMPAAAWDELAIVPTAVWDLQLTYASSGAVVTVLAGKVQMTADVTRAAV